MGWLSALTARTSIARGKVWSAEYWISSVRDQALALACLRFGEPADFARGLDRLPREVVEPFKETLVSSLEKQELRRALLKAIELLIGEVGHQQPEVAARMGPVLFGAVDM